MITDIYDESDGSSEEGEIFTVTYDTLGHGEIQIAVSGISNIMEYDSNAMCFNPLFMKILRILD